MKPPGLNLLVQVVRHVQLAPSLLDRDLPGTGSADCHYVGLLGGNNLEPVY
jgi:hypothetical protein